MNTAYVTTSIPYVNAHPHVGFALELLQADVIARWRRIQENDTHLLTGTDENALKNVLVAKQQGIPTQQLCDQNAGVFQKLLTALNIAADGFIRTSSTEHHRGVAQFWTACKKEDIVRKTYSGLYCAGCEDFYRKKDLKNGCCPVHNIPAETVEETNYFFRLTNYQKQLEDLITSGQLRIFPQTRSNEALALIRQGLWDFSISRPKERSGGWGVPVPGDPSQILYVWFDALTNYLTGIGYGSTTQDFAQYWTGSTERIHVLGKDILKFHALYWPAMLLSAGLPLPTTLLVHGFLTVDGQKISKSLGNTIDPFHFINRYGADALRYYLLREIPFGADGDFSENRFQQRYNTDLANGLGNLVRRLTTLCDQANFDTRSIRAAKPPDGIELALDTFNFSGAFEILWLRISEINRQIETVRPWNLLKQNQTPELNPHLQNWVQNLYSIAIGLDPFLPNTANKIRQTFSGIGDQQQLFARINPKTS